MLGDVGMHTFHVHSYFFPPFLCISQLLTETYSFRQTLRTHTAFRFLHQHARCPALLFISLRSVSFHLSLASITPISKKQASGRKILNTDCTSLIVLPTPFQQSDPKGCWDPLLELLVKSDILPPPYPFHFLSGLI